MIVHPFRVAGSPVTISMPETDTDAATFLAWLAATPGIIALDTETTGLDIFSPGYACRLVQFGSATEAYVLRVDRFADTIRRALAGPRQFVCHNAPFDLLVLDRVGLAALSDLGARTFDTYILGHLLDPRLEAEGGTGLGLKALSAIYVDADAPDTSKGLHEVFRRDYKATIATGWALIDIDHPTYVLYAGLDVILTSRLLVELGVLIKGAGLSALAHFEHRVQRITTALQHRGLRLDVPYCEQLSASLATDQSDYAAIAATYGVDNTNSTKQVTAGLLGTGECLTDTTPSGALAVGKEVLLPLADLDKQWERIGARDPNPLADAILRSKRAGKWRETYAQAFLRGRDADDRIHPSIRSLAARTARMSISNPPLQQLPSSDWTIRRAIIAEPGNVIGSCDYQAVELRVLAALADVKEMKRAIVAGEDLHSFTARLIYGDAFTPYHRKVAKGVGLGKVYGGGAATLSKQTGAPLEMVREAVARYDEVYPEVRAYGRRLQRQSGFGRIEVVTPFGRHLPMDRDRTYAGTNYVCQSSARDLLAEALVRVDAAGMTGHLLLPIHDEFLFEAPAAQAPEVARTLAALMSTEWLGVPIDTDFEVGARSWGSLYGCPADREAAA